MLGGDIFKLKRSPKNTISNLYRITEYRRSKNGSIAPTTDGTERLNRTLVSLGRTPHQPWYQWELTALDRAQVDRAMILTQVIQFADRSVEDLSGGKRQRAFLALALAQNPGILLLDEPTTYLDLRYQLELPSLLKDLQQQQELTIITQCNYLGGGIKSMGLSHY